MKDTNNLKTPFFEILRNLGFAHYDNCNFFATDALFWSLTRLFSHYYRIIHPIYTNQITACSFVESDIENFIIRQRIILNDIAYIIRQLLPKSLRGLKNPKGPTHPHNKEKSIKDIIKYVEKNKTEFKGLYEVLKKNENWMSEMRTKRDGIVHYKSKVVLFETKPDLSFAILDAAGTEKIVETPEGGKGVIMTPIFGFINTQTKSLWDFLNIDLKKWLEDYIKEKNMMYKTVGRDTKMSCVGIPLFKQINTTK
jgi:hypothetical protein